MMHRQSFSAIAKHHTPTYSSPVVTLLATGFCSPNIVRRMSATIPKAGAFFVSAVSFYGGCARGALERAGCLTSRSANLRTAATQSRFAAGSSGSPTLGATPMKNTNALNPSASHAQAWKARAMAALRADSSLSTRLARYNAAMARARQLEAAGGAV
ncbi:hypothetical protein SAMN05216264_112103 [Pseudomonas marincola]|nr:hypothetical protein SAMN05216264_112103 [Pseudomonas marincola]